MPGPMRVGVMLRFRDIIKPVAPARLTHALLRLHHYITKGGEGHVAAYFPPQRFIALHAGIEEFDQPQPQTALSAQLLDLPAISTPNTAITLASSLLEPIITGIGCWRPAKKVSSIGCGSTASPTIGAGPVFRGAVSDQKASAGIARNSSALACGKAKCSASRRPFFQRFFPRQIG